MNLKNIIDDLTTLGRLHKQVGSVGVGDTRQLNYILRYVDKEENDTHRETVYPLFYINPQTVVSSSGSKTFTVNMMVLDIVNQDLSNETDVMSDCDQIGDDIVAALMFPNVTPLIKPEYTIIQSVTKTFVSEKYDDIVSAVIFSLQVIIPEDINRCYAAFDNTLDPPTPPGQNYLLQENGDNLLQENGDKIIL